MNTTTITEMMDENCEETETTKILTVFEISCALLLILIILAGSFLLRLKLHVAIGVGTVRTVVQLSILGLILVPIFASDEWYIVLAYVLFMIVMAAFEASGRCKYFYQGMFFHITASFILGIFLIGGYGFAVVVQNDPWFEAQYVIPICGMLLGNSISAISVGLGRFLTELSEGQDRIELFLSKGATTWESVLPAFRTALRVGLTPTLNSMSVIGLVSIPGMMTGQILAGNSPSNAANYQMMIMFLIATTSCVVATTTLFLATKQLFDTGNHQLIAGRILTRKGAKKDILQSFGGKLWGVFKSAINTCCCWKNTKNSECTSLLEGSLQVQSNGAPPPATQYSYSYTAANPTQQSSPTFLEVRDISIGLPTQNGSRTTLYKDLSFNLTEGEILAISGPSGCGKSCLLRCLSFLNPVDEGSITFKGNDPFQNVPVWRSKVSYITQSKVIFPGNPRELIEQVSEFNTQRKKSGKDILTQTTHYIEQWNLERHVLEQSWHQLSGGESQRIILAMSMALQPSLLLLDEPTSACDPDSVQLIEQTIKESGITSIWVTHDREQANRVGHSHLSFRM